MLGVSLPPKVAHKQLELLCFTNSLLIGPLNPHLWRWGLPIRSSCKSHRCNHLSGIYYPCLSLTFIFRPSITTMIVGGVECLPRFPSPLWISMFFLSSTNGFWWPHRQNQARLDRLLPYARGGDVQISRDASVKHKWTKWTHWEGYSLPWRGQWFNSFGVWSCPQTWSAHVCTF